MGERKKLTAVVRGRVQGVWFRGFTRDHATRLGLDGVAVNEPDGSVRVVAEGERGDLDELVRILREGPPMARVDAVDTRWDEPEGGYTGFSTG